MGVVRAASSVRRLALGNRPGTSAYAEMTITRMSLSHNDTPPSYSNR